MQLQYPELLWGLLLLIIPILVHLLRLRRYRKTPFTNVRVLRRVFSESNRSSQLKRWLLLLTRLGLIGALVIGFCKPYIPSEDSGIEKDIVIYLDNSFSMQARRENSNLLHFGVQQLLQHLPGDLRFSLFTQSESYRRVQVGELQQPLLDLDFSPTPLSAEEIRLRAASRFSAADSSVRELWILSDFAGWESGAWEDWDLAGVKAVPLVSEARENTSIDSAFLDQESAENLQLTVLLTAYGGAENSPVSLYNRDVLIAKTGVEEKAGGGLQAQFTIPADMELSGALQITDDGLYYDNTLFLDLNKPEKIRVLSIGEEPAGFLERIFTPDMFSLVQTTLRELDYSLVEQQHLVLLNELETLPPALGAPLGDFVREGGSLLVIPAANAAIPSYNNFLKTYGIGYGELSESETLITRINFAHPVYRDVFEKQIGNFEFPQTRLRFALRGPMQEIIGYQDGSGFLSVRDGIYLFAAPLSGESSNFRRSPLIVPTLFSIGSRSLPRSNLYFQIGQEARLDLEVGLQEDEILKLQGPGYDFIPLQQSFARRTRLFFGAEPALSGNYHIAYRGDTIQHASFNYPRAESLQAALPPAIPPSFARYPDVPALVSDYQNTTRATALWKWFVILALLFLMAEMILQKTMR